MKPQKPFPLSGEQIDELATLLLRVGGNVYDHAERLFGVDDMVRDNHDEELFRRLRSRGKAFKCDECNHWLSTDLVEGNADICASCMLDD